MSSLHILISADFPLRKLTSLKSGGWMKINIQRCIGTYFHRSSICCLIALLFFSTISYSQAVDSQQISGTITDSSGAVVSKAVITVMNTGTGLTRVVNSNADGNYIALDLPIGTYTVTTSISGFKKVEIRGIRVEVGGKPSVPITLQVGEETDSITVESDSAQVHTTSAEVGSIVTSEEATNLQLNGRNYIQLIALAPGVSSTVASGFALFGSYGVSGDAQSVNGNRTDTFNYFIDGVDNKDNGGGGNNFVNISPDALEQFRNVASSYDASYGGTSGATVSVAIKSGGRNFHGSAYEYIRNDAVQAFQFRALNSTLVPKPALRYNDFGYTFGGPIFIPGHFNANREKLFFFVAQEYKRLRTSTVQNISIPTLAQLNTAL